MSKIEALAEVLLNVFTEVKQGMKPPSPQTFDQATTMAKKMSQDDINKAVELYRHRMSQQISEQSNGSTN